MASLLDEVLGQAGGDTAPLLQLPDERPPSLQPDPRVDALGQTFQAIVDYEKRKHQEGVDAGNWVGGWPWEGGYPTWKAAREGVDAYARGMQAGTLKGPGPFTTYHGSPYKFAPTPRNPLGEFDPAKIGTGEGNQAYGVGAAYLAEREAVAREGYRDVLKGKGDPAVEAAGKEFGDAQWNFDGSPAATARVEAARAALEKAEASATGHMYEVKVHADPEKFLHWDKPLSEQHPDVRDATHAALMKSGINRTMADYLVNNKTGRDVHSTLTRGEYRPDLMASNEGSAAATQALQEAGIPGIRYLDAGSRQLPHQIAQSKQAIVEKQNQIAEIQADIDRNPHLLPAFFSRRRAEIADHQKVIEQIKEQMSEGTHNLVVFSPETMEIIRRYGLAGLMLGGGGLLSPDKQEQ